MSTQKPARKPGQRGAISTYTESMSQEICEWIALGKPLREFCRQQGKPGWVTVYTWINTYPDFAERFARSRDIGADAIAEQALEIMDEQPEMTAEANGSSRRDSAYVAWQRARADLRLKLLAKWNPKKYGDAMALKHSDPNGNPLPAASMTQSVTIGPEAAKEIAGALVREV